MTITFGQLHDATLTTIHMDWAARSCEFFFAGSPSVGTPFSLWFSDITSVVLTAEAPWGPSGSVLEVSQPLPGRFDITMQSGDVISVAAPNYSIKGNINRTD